MEGPHPCRGGASKLHGFGDVQPHWTTEGYPLVNSHIAIENGHRTSEFSHEKYETW